VDADNNHTDRPGDADDEWGQTWSAKGGGSSMGADAASWTVSVGFQLRWCSGGYVLPSPCFP
jgi:hypothetical protein